MCVCVAILRKNVKASAVCRFTLPEVQEAFQGPYMEKQDSDSEWKEYSGKIPDPRPGTVNTAALFLKHRHRNDSFFTECTLQRSINRGIGEEMERKKKIESMSGSLKDEAQNTISLCH